MSSENFEQRFRSKNDIDHLQEIPSEMQNY